MRREIEDLTASEFPDVDSQKFDEWKKAIIDAKRKRNVVLIGGALLGVILFLTTKLLFPAIIAIFVALFLVWRKPNRLAKEIGIDWATIRHVQSKETIIERKIDNRGLIGKFLGKQSETKTPLLLKIAIVIQVWFLVGATSANLMKNPKLWVFESLLTVSIQIIALIAIWNLRKWGVLVFAAMAAFGLLIAYLSTSVVMSFKVVVAVIVLRGMIIIPALFYWKKMT